MKNTVLLSILMLLSACAGMHSSSSVFSDADEPHATIMRLQQGDVTETVYPANFVRVDGKPIAGGDSRIFMLIKPGKHTFRIAPDYDAVLRFQPPTHTRDMPPPYKGFEEKDLTLDVKAGMTYKIGVRNEGEGWTGFFPVLVKSWPSNAPEPQPKN